MRDLSVEYGDWGAKSPSSSCNSGVMMSTGAGAVGPKTGPIGGVITFDERWVTVSVFVSGASDMSLVGKFVS